MDVYRTTNTHVLRNTNETLEITFSAGDADGAVTYAVVDAAGTAVQSGAATNDAAAGKYTFVLSPQAAVKQLTVTWTGAWSAVTQSGVTHAEIVGAHLFSLTDARAFDKAALTSTTDYPDATIRATRAGITDFFEDVTGVSFVPRYRREVLDGPGAADLWLDRRQVRTLLSATVDDVALTASELLEVEVYEYGKLYRPSSWWGSVWPSTSRRNVIVAYEHGLTMVPWDVHLAALTYLKYVLKSSDISDRTVSWSNELGTFRQAIPGVKYPTGIPMVDAALGRYTPAMVLA